jgi:hypothetical protein
MKNSAGRRDRRTSTLTGDEVVKKRAMDRANQRNHRAKNKAHIRELEDKIAELAYRLKESENTVSRQTEIIRQLGGTIGDGDIFLEGIGIPSSQGSSPAGSTEILAPIHHHVPTRVQLFEEIPTGVDSDTRLEPDNHQPLDWVALDFGIGIPATNLFDPSGNLSFLDWGTPGTTSFYEKMERCLGQRPAPTQAATTSSMAVREYKSLPKDTEPEAPEWERLLSNLAPTTRLDEIIINSSRVWRTLFLRAGRQSKELSERSFPSISSLLNHSSDNDADGVPRPLSDELAAQVEKTPFKFLVERIAFMYKMSHLLRWLVCQTKETYDAMPEYMRPTKLQQTVPHPAWIDAITWPSARDAFIEAMDWGQLELFQKLTGESVSVNWPYPDSGAFMESPDGQLLVLHPLFEEHIRKMGNWTCGTELGEAFPFMKPYCRA